MGWVFFVYVSHHIINPKKNLMVCIILLLFSSCYKYTIHKNIDYASYVPV